MSINHADVYDVDSHIAEIYDTQVMTRTDDAELMRKVFAGMGKLRILELLCGTGRICLPLAQDGHEIVGLDLAGAMLDRAKMKLQQLPVDVQQKVSFIQADATTGGWPTGFDVVLLAGNCLYELATPEEQEGFIKSAAESLKPGGYVWVDNDHKSMRS